MPPMITTTSELSSQMLSVPLATAVCDVPITAPMPASAEPTKNAIMNVRWMLTPSAATIARSSTPARITMPVRVRLSQTQSAMPITSASAEDEEARTGVGEAARCAGRRTG